MSETELTRAQILGNLIRDARLYAGKRHRECAQALTLTEEEYKQAEAGDYALSLPHLEVLALYLKVPMGYFLGYSLSPGKTRSQLQRHAFDLRQRCGGRYDPAAAAASTGNYGQYRRAVRRR
ncbi:MAG: hypothetical protein M5U34_31725 [Chloroflexi bacterium]|nr:hypothetical protein [Chloroflexota bacterium]